MVFILAQPAVVRFQWELDVLLTNIERLDDSIRVVLLFTRHNDNVPAHLASRYKNVEIHVYEDRPDGSYPPSVRGWLWYKYLSEDRSREQESYFYIDSDIIFRELPDLSLLGATEDRWVGSDCGGYLDHDYLITRQNGEQIVQNFAQIAGVSTDTIRETPGAGAQWVVVNPTAELWYETYSVASDLWRWLETVDSDIQKWTAEMWANLYVMRKHGKTVDIHPEIDFCTPTDNVKMWDKVKILHNAGVVGDTRTMFYKGKYVDSTPFHDDLSFVRRDKASIKYVEAIQMVKT